MDRRIVAVATELGNVRAELEAQGFTVVDLEGSDLKQVDAVVVSGVSDNLTGVQKIETTAPVIDATGRSAEDVAADVAERIEAELS
ncbi:MAG TPA: YkuS family protein [Firmicutes bacterium]|nr:YkuS family protein [Bacillota bacterium]